MTRDKLYFACREQLYTGCGLGEYSARQFLGCGWPSFAVDMACHYTLTADARRRVSRGPGLLRRYEHNNRVRARLRELLRGSGV